jgi:ligand-binding SRPBCC domain-containing protein
MIRIFEREQLVLLPRREVFAFFADTANLERLTPPSLQFRIRTPLPIAMRAGALIDYRIALVGIPFAWRTLIDVFEPETRFVDVQLQGPYRVWRHTHEFLDAPGGTLVRDRVEYEVPFGPLGELARVLFVDRQLRTIFEYRRAAIASLFGNAPSTTPAGSETDSGDSHGDVRK